MKLLKSLVLSCSAFAVSVSVPIFASQSAHAALLYEQTSLFPSGTLFGSQNDIPPCTNGNFAIVFDDFRFTTSSSITGVTWQGGYFNGAIAPLDGFTISIFDDNGGQPGTSVFSEFVVGNASETFDGIYNYSATLASSFTANADTNYWLALVPDPTFPPQWGWQPGSGGNQVAYQDFFGSRSLLVGDFTFSLQGQPVPEPLTLLGASAAIAFGAAFKRRKA